MIAPLLTLQIPPRPPHTPAHDHRYDWGNAKHARVVVDGAPLGDRAIIRDNRVQAPMRPVFEALGATVIWHPETRKVVARKRGKTISLILGQNYANVPERVMLDYPPRMVRGRVYVPLRFVSEALGADVTFERRTKTVRVRTR